MVEAYQSRLGFSEADIYVRTYEPLSMPDLSTQAVPFTPLANLPPSAVKVDDGQPFPIIGWLKVKWVWGHPIWDTDNILTTLQPSQPGPPAAPQPSRVPLRPLRDLT